MKILPTLIFTLLYCVTLAQQSISIKQFGAKGDGISNDNEAFTKAAEYIQNKRGNITLIIPSGTYIVGAQYSSDTYFLEGKNLMNFQNIKNVHIKGIPSKLGKLPVIKYKDGLYFGTFYNAGINKGKPKCTPTVNNYNKNDAAYIGSCIATTQCSNITISNIEIDGNQEGMIIGGFYGDKGRQLNHRALYLTYSNDITIKNCYLHHMALDGIELSATNNTIIENVRSEYNGRQGISWVGGKGLSIKNSKFNYTGCSKIASAPCAGIDIEPESDANIENGYFENCEFMYNMGVGILNDRNGHLGDNMIFKKCTVLGYHNFALWVMGKNFKFYNCNIYGHITHALQIRDAINSKEFTYFENCVFSNVYKKQITKAVSKYLLEFNNQRVYFKKCNITAKEIGTIWHSSSKQQNITNSIFENTTFISDLNENYHASTSGVDFFNCHFLFSDKAFLNLNGAQNNNNTIKRENNDKVRNKMGNDYFNLNPYTNSIVNYQCTEK